MKRLTFAPVARKRRERLVYVMPFPLAHPAAVLPLRRYCPRWFSFPALVIGSLAPDVGYCFDHYHVAKFSHRLLAGSFGFCLPLGLLLVFMFYRLRRPMIQWLPVRERQIFESLGARPAGSPFVIAVSLLVGAWTHVFLDSITHVNGWLVERVALLRAGLTVGDFRFPVYDFLYSFVTFVGVLWLAWTYLNWLEQTAETRAWVLPGFKWIAALLLAAFTLLLSVANHNLSSWPVLVGIIALSAVLMVAFFAVTAWALRPRLAGGPQVRRPQNVGNPRA